MAERMKGETIKAFCKRIGITPETYRNRKREGRPLDAPPLIGTARAKNALKHSPWRQGFVVNWKKHGDGKRKSPITPKP